MVCTADFMYRAARVLCVKREEVMLSSLASGGKNLSSVSFVVCCFSSPIGEYLVVTFHFVTDDGSFLCSFL